MSTAKSTTGTKQAKTSTQANAEHVEKAVKAGKETFEKATKAGVEAWSNGYEKAVAMTQEQVANYFPGAINGLDEIVNFNKSNFEAAAKSGEAATKGLEAIGKEVVSYNQKIWETGMNRATALLGCKSVQEFIQVQADFARSNFDEMVEQGTKLSKLSAQVTNEAVAPISNRVNEVVEKISKRTAA